MKISTAKNFLSVFIIGFFALSAIACSPPPWYPCVSGCTSPCYTCDHYHSNDGIHGICTRTSYTCDTCDNHMNPDTCPYKYPGGYCVGDALQAGTISNPSNNSSVPSNTEIPLSGNSGNDSDCSYTSGSCGICSSSVSDAVSISSWSAVWKGTSESAGTINGSTWQSPAGSGEVSLAATWSNQSGKYMESLTPQPITVKVVAVEKLQYHTTAGWVDVSGVLEVPEGNSVEFKAISSPSGASWPSGKPVWGGLAAGTGETKTVTFNNSLMPNQTVTAECGNVVTANVKVYVRDPNNETQSASNAEGTDPITITGNFTCYAQDLFIKGRMMDVSIERTYRSDVNDGTGYRWFGHGWDMSYDIKLRPLIESDEISVFIGNNRPIKYTLVSGSDPITYLPPAGCYSKVIKNSDGTYVLIETNGEKKEFDPNGNIAAIRDKNNNAITFICDSVGRPTTITDDAGRDISLSYDGGGRLQTITDFNDRVWTYTYDSNNLTSVTTPSTSEYQTGLTTAYGYSGHNLTTITDPCGQTWLTNTYTNNKVSNQLYGTGSSQMEFHPDQSYTKVTNANGYDTNSVYNSIGQITKETVYTKNLRAGEPASYVTQYEYNSAGELTQKTLPGGNYVTYAYDANGYVTSITAEPNDGAANIVTRFTYGIYNQVATITDPCGNETTFDYNSVNGNLEKITYPEVAIPGGSDNPIVEFTYNTYGQVETMTDPNGLVTRFEYYSNTESTGKGQLLRVRIDPDDANITTKYEYDSVGNITKITDANGAQTTFAVNKLGQIISTANAHNHITAFKYNPSKMLREITQPIGGDVNQVVKYSYNILDKVKAVTNPLGYITRYGFGNASEVNDVNDAESNHTGYTYDERGLLWKVTDANGGVTEYSYTKNGKLAEIKDANNNETTYHYDGFDRLKWVQYPNDTNEVYGYDKNSNMTSKRTRKGDTISYTYDALNRLKTKTLPGNKVTTYYYDIAGRLVEVNDNGSHTYNYYDRFGRQINTTNPDSRVVQYEYDKLGRRTRMYYPDDTYIKYYYDAMSRLTDINDQSDNRIVHYDYDALSRRTTMTYGNDANAVYEYDLGNQLTKLTNNFDDTNSTVFEYSEYDKVGNRKNMLVD
ncbi:MAG: DUF6531 domain-containing protein, partial [Phycisphaerae bacterium]